METVTPPPEDSGTVSSCSRLKTKWAKTMETTTQFPVNQGTVVEVTCSYSDALNKGDSVVTCTSGTEFTFSVEPSCSIPGLLNLLLSFHTNNFRIE